MANTSKFERDDVLDKATRLFWRKGFLATSTRELQQALNMRPGSIYAAFGSKSGLFSEVLGRYSITMAGKLQRQIDSHPGVIDGLKAFMQQVLLNENDAPCELCLLAKTLSELGDDHPELLAQVRGLLKQMENRFTALITEAITRGELPAHTDAGALARHLQVQFIGLRTYLRMTADRAAVGTMLDALFTELRQDGRRYH